MPFEGDLEDFHPREMEMAVSEPTHLEESPPENPKETSQPCTEETEESFKAAQSDLHNCPKHLIKFIIECLGFPNNQILNSDELASVAGGVRENLKSLLGILENCFKGRIKSFSKELLKIVFEEGAERIGKLKLLQNNYIKKAFQGAGCLEMSEAKAILRSLVVDRLLKGKTAFVDKSRIVRKGVNERYLEMFVQELRHGKVKERVSKADKEWILQSKNF